MWETERHPETDYWKQENIVNCYTDTLKSLGDRLNKSKLPSYFNTMDNILGKKDKGAMHELAGYVRQRHQELVHMKVQKQQLE